MYSPPPPIFAHKAPTYPPPAYPSHEDVVSRRLNRKKSKWKRLDEDGRREMIIKRANWYFRPVEFGPIQFRMPEHLKSWEVAYWKSLRKDGHPKFPLEWPFPPGYFEDLDPESILKPYIYPDDIDADEDAIAHAWDLGTKLWETMKSRAQLKSIIETARFPRGIDKIVCFGNGGFFARKSHPDFYFADCVLQHLAVLDIAEWLSARAGRKMEIFSQEPCYTQALIDFLANKGIVSLDAAYGAQEGWAKLGSGALVFSLNTTSLPIRQLTQEIADPAAMIWRSLDDGGVDPVDPDIERCQMISPDTKAIIDVPGTIGRDLQPKRVWNWIQRKYDKVEEFKELKHDIVELLPYKEPQPLFSQYHMMYVRKTNNESTL